MQSNEEWCEVQEILRMSKQLLIGGRETDALTEEDLMCLHHDACVIASAVIIAKAIRSMVVGKKGDS